MNLIFAIILACGSMCGSFLHSTNARYNDYDSELFYSSVDSLSEVLCIEDFGSGRSQDISFRLRVLV